MTAVPEVESLQSRFEEYRSYHKFLDGIENLSLNFAPIERPGDHPLEQVFYYHLFKNLVLWDGFKDFDFYIIGVNHDYSFTFNDKSVVFCLSNETHEIPDDIAKAGLVFSPYCPLEKELPNCFPIPLGYNGSLGNPTFRTLSNREFDVFFSGNIYKKRLPFYINLRIHEIANRLTSFVGGKPSKEKLQFNRKFTGGLTPEQYSQVLMDSKIALIPEGYISDISFRFFEASRFGCVIVTTELPDWWFFKKFPGIQVNNWNSLHSEIKRLLKDEDRMIDIQQKTVDYYKEFCSEKAVADYVIEKILNKLA